MVRNYKRKTTDKWSKEDLLEALICIKNGEKKIGECTQQYKISRATLYRHFQKMMLDTRNYVSVFAFQKCGGKPILTRVEEEVLETTVKELMDKGFTVTSSDIKRICYEYCFTNGIPNRFSEGRRMASDDWYYGFLKRRPNLGVLLSKTKGNSTSERETQSDEQCGAKEAKAKEGEEKSQDAHKNLEMHKNASDEDACPPDAPVLKKPLKRLFETEKQKKQRKKARRPPPAAVRRQRQNVRKGKLPKGGRTNLAKSLSDDDEFFDFEAMEVKEEKDDGTDEHKESENDEDDNTDEHEQETETTISGSEDGSDSDFNKVDIVTEEGEGSTKKHDERNQESGESEQDNDQVLGSEEEEDECTEEDTKEEKRECEGDSNESGIDEEEQECEGDSNDSGIEEEEEESESDFDDDPEGEEENETSNGDESNAEDEGDKEE